MKLLFYVSCILTISGLVDAIQQSVGSGPGNQNVPTVNIIDTSQRSMHMPSGGGGGGGGKSKGPSKAEIEKMVKVAAEKIVKQQAALAVGKQVAVNTIAHSTAVKTHAVHTNTIHKLQTENLKLNSEIAGLKNQSGGGSSNNKQ